jgi:integrase
MPRQPNPIPSYRLHKKTGRAVITVRDHLGARRDVLMPGPHGSAESLQEYERLCAQLRAAGGRLPAKDAAASDLTIAELTVAYLDHVRGYYLHPETGEPTSEQEAIQQALRPLIRLFGPLPVAEFDCTKLQLVRDAMIDGAWETAEERARREGGNRPAGWCRGTINKHVHRIRGMFRWGLTRKLVPASVLVELSAVAGLKRGRSKARETTPVTPVDVETVEATLPHLPPVPADIVRLLLLCGARVGELCSMRGKDLDQAGPVWLFNVAKHKTQHHGHARTVAFGPRAQLVLRRYLKEDPEAFVFSAADQDEMIRAQRRAARKTPVQPSQQDRRKKNPEHKPGDRFDPKAVNRAVARACEKASVEHWHVHQLRHTAALLIEREHYLEAARATLGHRTVSMTTHYSGIDRQRACEVMQKIG